MALLLGIDLGTTKDACVILAPEDRTLLACESMPHEAAVAEGVQDVGRHLEVVRLLLGKLPEDLRRAVGAIGVTGQMHGVVAWSEKGVAPLYTWQSKTPDLALFQAVSPSLNHGFGVATLAQMAKNGELGRYRHAATIHDFLVWQLTGRPEDPVMDFTDAASWGAYDLRENRFEKDVLQKLGIPEEIMPRLVPPGSSAGSSVAGWGVPANIPVMAAIGDNQSSVCATAENPEDEIYLTLGTGAQLSVVLDRLTGKSECRPFPGDRFLAVAAPLCGGAAWAWLQKHVRSWLEVFPPAHPLDDAALYDRIDELACSAMDDEDLPILRPHFLGERGRPELRGSLENLTLENFTPAKLAASLALGIVENLRSSLPEELMRGRQRLVVSGNAVRRTRALQKACVKCFEIEPAVAGIREEAACGAALLSRRLLK